MATQPSPVVGVPFIDSPSLVLPAAYPTLVVSGGALGIIAAGSSTVTPVGGGGGTVQTAAPISGDGSSGNKVTVAPGAVFPAMVIQDPTPGINKMLILNANVASGDPAISFQSNGTETGYIRVDTSKTINVVPGAAGFGVLWSPGEGQGRFSWGATGIAFFGGTVTAKQAVGNALTNNIALGTGTAGTLTNFAGSTYATDAPVIAGDLNQLAIKIAAIETALKTGYNLVSN